MGIYIPAGITTSDIGSISGTGADNRIPTFTDATNIQGESNLTFDGSTLTVTGAFKVGVDGTGHDVIFYGDTSGKKVTWNESSDALHITNETPLTLGTDNDIAIVHRATALNYDTEWSIGSGDDEIPIIEGTSDHPGVAANSLIVSNLTNDGDIMFVTSDAGNSMGYLKMDGSDATVMVGGDFYSFNAAANLGTTSKGWNSLVLKTGGAIGVTDDTDSIVIASGGGVTFSQTMTATNIEMGDGGYIRFGGDYPMIDDNGYLQFITATNVDFWWTHGSQNVMQLDTSAYQLHLGAGVAADAAFILDGNAVDYHIGLDDTEDSLNIGYSTTLSDTTSIFQFYKTATKYTVARFNPYFTSDGSSSVVTGLNVAPVLVGASGDTTYQTWLDMSYGGITTQAVSETIGNISTLRISEPNITIGSGSSVTAASSLYIAGAPTEATSNYALWVDSGVTRLDGAITTYGDINVRGTTPDLILGDGGAEDTSIHFGGGTSNTVNGATTDTDWVIARDNTDYAFTLNTGDSINHIGSAQRFSFYHSGASTYAARFMGSHTQKNDNQILYGLGIGYDLVATERTTDSTIYWYAHCVIGTGTGGTVTTQGESQTIPLITSLYVDEPGITDSGDTITRGSTVYIENAPTEGDTANYALWVDSGKARLDDGVIIGPSDSTNNLIDNATNGSGASTLYIGNTSITTSSDARLKTDIESTSIDALNLIDELNVVDFGWDDPTDTIKYGKNYRGKYVGMLAQETVKVAPWIINDQGGGRDCTNCMAGLECDVHGMFQVEYQHLVPTLVKAIQELRQELQEVKDGNR